ncbi:MAG: radical SAM protein [Rhodothermaceae bacterium]|nr:radical SAM protein [Rhodothermaceae bacterium]MYD20218.1 radical SAM protein [Rhodothermaceae bacterium]MYI43568.1 radical SAM protein [Rhodothermaceae bacterium]
MKIRNGPDGIHFFDRNSGTNLLLNEVVLPPEIWSRSPRQVSIALTNACDLDCLHCYAPKTKARLEGQLVKRWMSELDEQGCFGVGFGGGEPTLHPELVDICNYGQSETGLAITITTHGHHLSNDLLSQLAGSVNFIRISMDGVDSTYESIRNRSFNHLLAVLKKLDSLVPFGINYVVNHRTIDDLDKAILVAESLKAKDFLLLPEEPFGRGVEIDSGSLKRLKEWVDLYKGNLRLSVSSSYAAEFPSALPLEKEPEEMAFSHIDAAGVLKRSSYESGGCKIDSRGVITAYRLLNRDTARGLL